MNALLHDDRALVSNIHGTTRDTIEDTVMIGGTLFRFIDTAGIRQSSDAVERMGIERTWQAIDKANVVLWVVDVTSADTSMIHDILDRCEGKALIAVLNKTDLDDDVAARSELNDVLPEGIPIVAISAKRDADVEALRDLIVETASLPDVASDAVIVTNARHYQALTRARDAIARAIDGLDSGLSGDLLGQDIRECLHWLGEITGEITTDNILGEIFAHFCIGK